MKFILELHLRGTFVIEKEIDIPAPDMNKDFIERCQIRELHIEHQKQIFKIEYLRQILKVQNEYEIYLRVSSDLKLKPLAL